MGTWTRIGVHGGGSWKCQIVRLPIERALSESGETWNGDHYGTTSLSIADSLIIKASDAHYATQLSYV